jgi:hypothetical protein
MKPNRTLKQTRRLPQMAIVTVGIKLKENGTNYTDRENSLLNALIDKECLEDVLEELPNAGRLKAAAIHVMSNSILFI